MSLASLKNGDPAPVAHFDFGPSVPNNFTFSPDGRYLFGSSYYTGVSNIFRYEIAGGKLDAVSNTDTGFMRPIPLGDDRLFIFRFTGRGFVPATIDAKPLEDVGAITFLGERLSEERPVVRTWNVGSPMAIPYDSMKKEVEPYRLLGQMRPESFYPILQGYKDTAAVGVRLNFSDPIRLNRASLVALVQPGHGPAVGRAHSPARRLPALRLARLRRAEQRGLLRSVRPDEGGPQGLRRRRRPHQHADLRRAAAPRARPRRQLSPATSIVCPSTRTSRWT